MAGPELGLVDDPSPFVTHEHEIRCHTLGGIGGIDGRHGKECLSIRQLVRVFTQSREEPCVDSLTARTRSHGITTSRASSRPSTTTVFKRTRVNGEFVWCGRAADHAFLSWTGSCESTSRTAGANQPLHTLRRPAPRSTPPAAEKEVKLTLLEPCGVVDTSDDRTDLTPIPTSDLAFGCCRSAS